MCIHWSVHSSVGVFSYPSGHIDNRNKHTLSPGSRLGKTAKFSTQIFICTRLWANTDLKDTYRWSVTLEYKDCKLYNHENISYFAFNRFCLENLCPYGNNMQDILVKLSNCGIGIHTCVYFSNGT